jgi:hypothetical protein
MSLNLASDFGNRFIICGILTDSFLVVTIMRASARRAANRDSSWWRVEHFIDHRWSKERLIVGDLERLAVNTGTVRGTADRAELRVKEAS